ncbi:hypothetical protein DBR17_16310 [Sphingomonas sp. HMWF008]|nr:hypothetical protein DBR17_16310 [Sphingomonas sp. HMWF008]
MNREAVLEDLAIAHYADIADEYYDEERHPTCASLRELSRAFLLQQVAAFSGKEQNLIEVGVGKSLLAPAWLARGGRAKDLVLVDSSPDMLAYSDKWRSAGARLELSDACSLPIQDGSVDILFASLGDPYNLPSFWREVARVLRSGGRALFTTPAHEWATRFRTPDRRDAAEFVRRDGAILLMPSSIPSDEEQIAMFAKAGLILCDVQAFSALDLKSTPAPKLLCIDEGEPVLRGYVVRR